MLSAPWGPAGQVLDLVLVQINELIFGAQEEQIVKVQLSDEQQDSSSLSSDHPKPEPEEVGNTVNVRFNNLS